MSKNEISDIKVLEKVKLKALEILILSVNQISDINFLSNVNFKLLKELDLFYNKIAEHLSIRKTKIL